MLGGSGWLLPRHSSSRLTIFRSSILNFIILPSYAYDPFSYEIDLIMAPRTVSKPFQCLYEISRQRLASRTSRGLAQPPLHRSASSFLASSARKDATAFTNPLTRRPSIHQQHRSKSHITAATAQARSKIGVRKKPDSRKPLS